MTQDTPALHEIQPINDPRWARLLQRHPRSSVFHTVEWLEALRRTYSYEPVAFTTSPSNGELHNAVVFCRVESWLTGRRLVSLPFSDHCDPLVDATNDWVGMVSVLEKELHEQKLHYIEFRPKYAFDMSGIGSHSTHSYCLHQIDLQPDIHDLFGDCHKNSTQRKIRRAEREGLRYEEGRSEYMLECFYDLLVLTRRRHALPPQPMKWFRNLINCFGQALKIRLAFRNDQPVAAILTLRYKDTLVYKYGCSDARFHELGGMHLLLWRSIQEAKEAGLCLFDLGRSDWKDKGLITFKDRWGAKRSTLTYLRLLASAQSKNTFTPAGADWKKRTVKKIFRCLPDRILRTAGELVYKHIG